MPSSYHDPALDASHQHTHDHIHHSTHAQHIGNDQPVYTIGTTDDHSASPIAKSPGYAADHRDHDRKHESTLHDVEKGSDVPITPSSSCEGTAGVVTSSSSFYRRFRVWFHLGFWLLATAWWSASLALHHLDKNWVVPFLIWLFITLRIATFYFPASRLMTPVRWMWQNTAVRLCHLIPERLCPYVGAAGTMAVILVGSFASEESDDNTRANRAISLFGLIVLIFALWATSRNREAINWHTVIAGMLMQYVVALFVLRTLSATTSSR